MKNSLRSPVRPALLASACAALLLLAPFPTARAAEAAPPRPLADKAPDLPLTPTFTKAAGGDGGPYVLELKNDSKDTLKLSATVFPSVAFHADTKARNLPEHPLGPGETWSISGLASTDKVTVTADGFAPLKLTVP